MTNRSDLPRYTDSSFFAGQPWMEYVFILSACCGQLMTQAGTTNALTHMYQLQADFKSPDSMTPWFIASFGLAVGTLILISGRIGDAYGLKNALIGGYIWTAIWSILSGISYYDRHAGPSFYICCRTFQGAGVSFLLPNVLGAVGRVYTTGTIRKRLVFGAVGFCAPCGGFLGVFMSGVIAVRTQRWDWNYYAYAIFSVVSGILTWMSVPHLPPELTKEGKRQEVDIIGAVLGIGSLTLFNFSWNQAPVVGWQSAYIITLLVVSVPMFIAFIVWEVKFAKNPLIPPEVLGNSRFVAVLMILFLGWGAFGVNIYHCFVLFQRFRHYSPFASGAALTPAPPMGIIAAISCSLLINHKTEELILFGSMLAFLAASIILGTAGIHESYFRHTLGLWIIAPFGMDWSFPAGSIVLSEGLPPHLQGLAGSLVSVTMNYGISIFLGVAGTVEGELLKQRPDDPWRAWRGALYFNIGISGLSSSIAFYFVVRKFYNLYKHGSSHPEIDDAEKKEHEPNAIEQQTSETSGSRNSDLSNERVKRDSISELSAE